MTAADPHAAPRFQLLASVPRGFGDILAAELVALGALDVRERGNAVAFTGTLETAYRACLESRVASRVFLELARFEAVDDATIQAALRSIDWASHVDPRHTLACEWSGRHPAITHTHFGTLRLKDAICDSLRESVGARPDIATGEPGLRVHAHAVGTRVTVSIDLAGEGLHRRGWRLEAGEAPLRENVAAGILLRAGWPAIAAAGGVLLDPMCGAGTFLVEGLLIAAQVAPGLGRRYHGFTRWRRHDAALWERLCAEARERAAAGLAAARARGPIAFGRDLDRATLRVAAANVTRAGLDGLVQLEAGALAEAAPPAGAAGGLFCANPPYGVRLGDVGQARQLHRELGRVLRERFAGWKAAVLVGDPALGLELGLRASRVHTLWNGAIECRLLRIDVEPAADRDLLPRQGARIDATLAGTPGGRMFGNRITKNLRNLSGWLRREGVGCYRLYDADMPEYALAVDVYTAAPGGASAVPPVAAERWLYVQEYAAPREIPEETVRRRRSEALAALVEATGVPADHVRLRQRRVVRRGDQYAKRDDSGEFHVVGEGGLRFRVNFDDYLDTGLFLDHRITRARLREASRDARFLNLFGYTGSATVYAAAGGAAATTTVDLSATYLDWARRNLELNGHSGPRHRLLQADAREWLREAASRTERYELVFCDPPTFSNSKRMEGVLDVQRDHAALVDACVRLLSPGGLLVFSTNAQRFRLDPALAERHAVEDVTRATIPPDFARNARIHQCFEIRARSARAPRPAAGQ
jgi:23S rRNA (guanine2445-N2)-methyltransferase / 23S rRNA (guanine2069-N7)-methyltransferase